MTPRSSIPASVRMSWLCLRRKVKALQDRNTRFLVEKFHFWLTCLMLNLFQKLPVPWKAVATSVPFWAIVVTHTCSNFGWYMLLVELPTYMKHIGFNISENSVLSALPYLCLFIFSVIWSNCLDWAKSQGWLTTVSVRKISTAVGQFVHIRLYYFFLKFS